jgi:hypothetical protein
MIKITNGEIIIWSGKMEGFTTCLLCLALNGFAWIREL